jgi:poly-gamma-glutamate capsule biosynthesis protein CapA/YwtB (metallophosphatase superfamily)
LREDEITRLMEQAGSDKPAVAFMHWGEEWQPALGERQKSVLGWLAAPVGGGVDGDAIIRARPSSLALVLGGHAHVASEGLQLHRWDVVVGPSMGNLVFDQPRGNGALVEVRFFPGGTHAVRWIPIGNVLTGHSDSSTTKPFFQENPAGTR